jgi:hypothetical protein
MDSSRQNVFFVINSISFARGGISEKNTNIEF